MNRARRAGRISWDAIRDDGFQLHTPQSWTSPDELAGAFLSGLQEFHLDRQTGQPRRLLIAVEAAGMLPQIERITDPYGIPCYAAGGFDSATAKYQLAKTLSRWRVAEVLHIGDHDPSGVHLFSSMAEDVTALAEGITLESIAIRFTRLAVTPEQIGSLNLPTAPPKAEDRRSFEGRTVQAEAIPPDTLAAIGTRRHRGPHRPGRL